MTSHFELRMSPKRSILLCALALPHRSFTSQYLPMRIETVLARLKMSRFRARFTLGPSEKTYAEGRGSAVIGDHARKFICERLASAAPPRDGQQTPMRGHPVFIAQHATATCCRGCMEKWHRVPQHRAMSPDEINFTVSLIMAWLAEQTGPDVQGELF